MHVEALYRDGHKEDLVVDEAATLIAVVKQAVKQYDRSAVKHLRIVPNVHDRRPVKP